MPAHIHCYEMLYLSLTKYVLLNGLQKQRLTPLSILQALLQNVAVSRAGLLLRGSDVLTEELDVTAEDGAGDVAK